MVLLKNMTIKLRFSIVIGLIALTLIVQGAVLFYSNAQIRDQAKLVSDVEMPVLNKAHQLKLSVVQVQQWLTDISATRAKDGLNDGFDEA